MNAADWGISKNGAMSTGIARRVDELDTAAVREGP